MEVVMRLNEEPFLRIKSGIKDVEYRVNDEKRQQLKVGDKITFYLRPLEQEKLEATITDLKYYKNLLDMYTDSFDRYLSGIYKSPQDAVDDTKYYTKEEIEKYGCVAIFFKLDI